MTKKTDKELAEAHGKWLMDTIEVVAGAIFDAMKPIMVDVMEHGIKHGRELQEEDIQNRFAPGEFLGKE